MLLVGDIVEVIENKAKREYAYEWDNCSLACGNANTPVTGILVTLDVTAEVVNDAVSKHCNMIVSHHPVIFKAVKTLDEATFEGEIISMLIKNGIALYSAHTSLDIAEGGVNDSFCGLLGLKNVDLLEPFVVNGEKIACARTGSFTRGLSGKELIELLKSATGADNILTCNVLNSGKAFKTCALCTGAGEEFIFSHSCDVFITGEIKYHTALEAKRKNLSFIAAGHYFTEKCIIHTLAGYLQNSKSVIQYDTPVYETEINTNPFD